MDFQKIEGFPKEILDLCYCNVPVFPYIVAVTGHRNFADASCSDPHGFKEATIKEAFKNELESIAKKWKKYSKSYAPIILLTGMADGADQIAAEAALEINDAGLNVKVVAVLPMERDIFRLTVDNQSRFDDLMKRVHYSFALPVDPLTIKEGREKELGNVDDSETEKLRQRQYCRLAEFLAVHSHILFAFWDGIDDKSPGGTAEVVRLKLKGSDDQEQDSFLTRSSVGPVVQFLTPRDNDANRAVSFDENLTFEKIPVFFWTRNDLWQDDKSWHPFPCRAQMTEKRRLTQRVAGNPGFVENLKELSSVLFGASGSTPRRTRIREFFKRTFGKRDETGTAKILKKLGQINRDAVDHYAEFQSKLQESEKYLWNPRNDSKEYLDAGTRILVDHYCVADQLALLFQEKSQNIGRPIAKIKKWLGMDGKKKQSEPPTASQDSIPDQDDARFGEEAASQALNSVQVDTKSDVDDTQNKQGTNSQGQKPDKVVAPKKFKYNGYPFWGAAFFCLGVILDCFWKFHQSEWNHSVMSDCFSSAIAWKLYYCYVATGFVVCILVVMAWLRNFLYRYFRSRAVAEALRVQIFWRVAKMNDCVSGFYRSHQIEGSEWLRAAINGLDALLPAPEQNGIDNDRLIFVRDVWIDGQLKYFKGCIQDRRYKEKKEWWDSPWYKGGLFLLMLWLPLENLLYDPILEGEWSLPCFCCIVGYYLTVALVSGYFIFQTVKKQILCLKLEADRYERMIFPYERAVFLTERDENSIGDEHVEHWRRIFRQLGAEAIAENADWLLTVGERKLVLPR